MLLEYNLYSRARERVLQYMYSYSIVLSSCTSIRALLTSRTRTNETEVEVFMTTRVYDEWRHVTGELRRQLMSEKWVLILGWWVIMMIALSASCGITNCHLIFPLLLTHHFLPKCLSSMCVFFFRCLLFNPLSSIRPLPVMFAHFIGASQC